MTILSSKVVDGGGVIVASYNGSGTQYVVESNSGAVYIFYINGSSGVAYKKSTDGGATWGSEVVIYTGTTNRLSVWFDRWSGIAAGLIHVAWDDTVNDDLQYITVDTENSDTLSNSGTPIVIFAGGSAAGTGALSISRSRGGNVFVVSCIDAGAESITSKLLNANVPAGAWSAALAAGTESAASDQWILLPGWASDNNDMMMFFLDASTSELTRKLYDDSANSWAESSSMATITPLLNTTGFPNFAATVDITNSRNLVVAWTAADTLNADLLAWHVTESTVTALTDVITNQTDDQGLCAIGIDTDTQDWHVYYGGRTGGAETFASPIAIYRKISTDDGATWGSEAQMSAFGGPMQGLFMTPRFTTGATVEVFNGGTILGIGAIIDIDISPAGGGVATPLFGGGVI